MASKIRKKVSSDSSLIPPPPDKTFNFLLSVALIYKSRGSFDPISSQNSPHLQSAGCPPNMASWDEQFGRLDYKFTIIKKIFASSKKVAQVAASRGSWKDSSKLPCILIYDAYVFPHINYIFLFLILLFFSPFFLPFYRTCRRIIGNSVWKGAKKEIVGKFLVSPFCKISLVSVDIY